MGIGTEGEDFAQAVRVPLFLVLVTLFHVVEALFTICFHPDKVEFRMFLLTPVPMGGYSIAMVAALVEYWVRQLVLWKFFEPSPTGALGYTLLCFGFVVSLSGWALRAMALFTAQANFTHIVRLRRVATHQLVTGGVYSLCRHPGYVGWF